MSATRAMANSSGSSLRVRKLHIIFHLKTSSFFFLSNCVFETIVCCLALIKNILFTSLLLPV